MKSALVFCLLGLAGAYALPSSEVTPTQNRIVDYWLINAIEVLTQWIKERGLDPVEIDREFEYVLFDGLIEIAGFVEKLQFKGASNINIDNLYYNMVLGRLDINLVIPELWLEVGNSRTKVAFGDFKADLEINGGIILSNIRIAGDAILKLYGGSVYITNINPKFSIERIEASLTVLESGQDYSDRVREFFNERIPALLNTYENEINTIIGEQIKGAINRWWR
ncbi:jg12165 [Pararge aegeria aegeria]|uniref:Jg12165 protein n=1 Tax=Pararge aegeria aegeria TaxID=348720 RepID=A0A8S4RS16_9NEOP|nr:jg12165 [Pararge aegeria aegeria]